MRLKFSFMICISVILYNNTIQAGVFTILGPCSDAPLFQEEFSVNNHKVKSAGEVTIELLTKAKIPYIGSIEGLNSIFDTPIGRDAMEWISATEYLAYGWCYKVNEIEPSEYPHEVYVTSKDSITWWFGYARFKDGKWIEQCTPSYLRASPKFCL
jgi:hypothetical protein